MAVYALNIIFIVLWALLCFGGKQSKSKTSFRKKLFLTLCFVQLFLISSLRYNIGNDYSMYSEAFLKIGIMEKPSLSYLDWEYGFVVYTRLITMLTNDPIIYFAITAFICIAPVFVFIYKSSKLPWLSVLLYVNLSFFYLSMNFLRQSMAIGISLLAWEFLKNRKPIMFILLISCGAFFHMSVLILLPLYFICGAKSGAQLAIFYGYLLLVFFISSNGVLNLYTASHSFKYENSVFIKEGLSIAYSLIPFLILLITVIFQKKLLEFDEKNKYLIHMMYASAFFMLIMSRHAIMERFSYYTYIYVIVLLPELILSIKSSYDKLELGEDFTENLGHTVFCGSTKGMLIGISSTAVVLIVTTGYNYLGMYAGSNGIHGVYPFEAWINGIVR